MKVVFGWALLLGVMGFTFQTNERVMIHLIGDSTASEKGADARPETGWGMAVADFFREGVTITNHAKNGRSTRTFIDEGRWQVVLDALKPGDYVFIQFGHNDHVPSKTDRYTTPEQYMANLTRFVKEARQQQANPVLLTPVSRRKYDATGQPENTLAEYAGLVRQVAAAEAVPLLDLTARTQELLAELGPARSQMLFNHLKPGQHPNYPEGRADDTHFNELGARMMAELVVAEIRRVKLPLQEHFITKQSGE